MLMGMCRIINKEWLQEGSHSIRTYNSMKILHFTCMDTVRTVLAIAGQKKWLVYQMDVKSAFLNGYLEEEVYVEQPQCYEVPGQYHKVYKLKKELYGLKQAPKAW